MPRPWYTKDAFKTRAGATGAFFGVFVLLFVLGRIPFVARVYSGIGALGVAIGTWVGGVVTRVTASEESLTSQLAACEEKVRSLAVDTTRLASDEARVSELESLLGYQARANAKGITARITLSGGEGKAEVHIDKGTNDGVTNGMAAVTGDGLLFGVIIAVDGTSATVRETASRESSLPATVLSKTETVGLVTGKDGALLSMDFIPQNTTINVNDLVVTSGLSGIVPAGLVLGMVTEVAAPPSSPFKRALLTSLFDPRTVTTLLLLTTPKTPDPL